MSDSEPDSKVPLVNKMQPNIYVVVQNQEMLLTRHLADVMKEFKLLSALVPFVW